MMMNKVEMISF